MLTQEIAIKLFEYNPQTGTLTWKQTSRKGKEAGYNHAGADGKSYRRVETGGREYPVHRVIWLIVHGVFPVQIDHIDGNGLNNRLSNLREVDQRENNRNKRKAKNNTSGCSGVWTQCGRWKAQINVSGARLHLGSFASKDDAIAARKAAEKRYGFHENHGTDRPL